MTSRAARLRQSFLRSDRMIGRCIADEFVLVPLAREGADLDAVYNLNALGAFIWERLDGATPGDAIVDAITAAFAVDRERAARDYCGFVDELVGLQAASPAKR